MHIPTLSARRLFAGGQQDDTEHAGSQRDEQRRFAALMMNAPVTPVRRVTGVDDAIKGKASDNAMRAASSGEIRGLPAQFRRLNLRFSRMRWRITNGPLAGMTIEASSDDNGLYIHLRGDDLSRLQQALGVPDKLAETLSTQLNRRVILEVSDAVSPNQ
jgi:hypothetical protein